MGKIEIYECDSCGCVCDENTLKETVTISNRIFYFCLDCFTKSKFYTFLEERGLKPYYVLENLPINNGWDGKKKYIKVTYKKQG